MGGINTYAYGYQNPVMNIDPFGLWVPQAIGASVNLTYESYSQFKSGEFNGRRLLIAGATGALGGFGSTLLKAMSFGAISGAIGKGYQEMDRLFSGCQETIDYSKVIRSSLLGATGGGFAFGIGRFGHNIYKAPKVSSFNPHVTTQVNYGQHGSAIGAVVGGIIGNQ